MFKKKKNKVLYIWLLLLFLFSILYILSSNSLIKLNQFSTSNSETYQSGYILYPITETRNSSKLRESIPKPFERGVYLLKSDGEIFNYWPLYVTRAKLLKNCNLMALLPKNNNYNKKIYPEIDILEQEKSLVVINWEGKIIKQILTPRKLHHNFQILPNGNILVLYSYYLSDKEKVSIKNPRIRNTPFLAEGVYELTPSGEVVWEWDATDHLDLNNCGKKGCASRVKGKKKDDKDWLHLNNLQKLGKNKWYDSGDQRFHPDNILLSVKNWWEAIIIDFNTGQIVWRYSGDYKGGLSGPHEALMISHKLPGSGNILIFDNGGDYPHSGESYILEINPTNNSLVNVIDYGNKLFSKTRGSIQRLPNGNTFISEDLTMRLLEVNPKNKIIWQYNGKENFKGEATSRARKYPKGYCSKLS